MFCPVCRDEFRSGFTRCEGCDAELVEQLGSGSETRMHSGSLAPDMSGPKADYCGFLEMAEAREARDLLWNNGILSEIAIRPATGCLPGSRLKGNCRGAGGAQGAAPTCRGRSSFARTAEPGTDGPVRDSSAGRGRGAAGPGL
jgi:hypothetical protein